VAPLPLATRRFLAGLSAEASARLDDAEQAYADAHALEPGSPRPLTALARVLLARGAVSAGLVLLDEALQRDPRDVAALTLGYDELRLAGRLNERRRRNRLALDLDPGHPVAISRAVESLAIAGPIDALPPRFARIEALAEDRADAARGRAFVALAANDMTAALSHLDALVARHPASRDAAIERMRLFDLLGQHDLHGRTIAAADPLLALRVDVRRGDMRAVESHLQSVIALNRWDALATAAWAIARRGGNAQVVLNLSARALAQEPSLPAAAIEHARIAAIVGKPADALQSLHRALELLPPDDGADLAAVVAHDASLLQQAAGRHGEALRWTRRLADAIRALTEDNPGLATAWREVAGGQRLSGNRLAAIERWRLLTHMVSEPAQG
jgi:predicted Zn-dependent protease